MIEPEEMLERLGPAAALWRLSPTMSCWPSSRSLLVGLGVMRSCRYQGRSSLSNASLTSQ